MKIIETTFEKMSRERLLIGFEGENQRATVRIDCASVFVEYPNATPALTVKPLFADAYPVVVDRNGTCVDWLITSEILSFTGDGEIQLTFVKDQVICKSAVSKIRVCRSLQVTGEMPTPVESWVDAANAKLAEVDAQIVELEGMVDTATDAATRAEQSASTASAKAEQAAGSAATATAKATEATNAAGTATAKAAEAQTAAQTATEKANAAAESERIATAKAAEAAQSAQTAAQKAEQITEAAQIATGKAEEASASATAAQTSATNAASSATAASASETAAKASETAASTSASQAAQSVLDAGTAAQTATQKATEASQSATNAATFAGTAATKAEEAAASAQAASDAKTAVEQTAEQLADSLEQIEQNTQDIAELDERKANIDGYYPDMTVGNAEQLNSSKYVENSEPYTLRPSGGTSDIGNREYVDAVVGGTLAWNQAVRDEASENSTDFADVVTVTDAVEDAAGVKVKLEPVQDLHGYDHPWPAGGGKNKFCDVFSEYTRPYDYRVFPITLAEGTYRLWASKTKDTVTGCAIGIAKSGDRYTDFDGLVLVMTTAGNANSTVLTVDSTWTDPKLCVYCSGEAAFNSIFENYNVQLESGAMPTSFEPYANICPITGWDGVKVSRTGSNINGFHPCGGYISNGIQSYNATANTFYLMVVPCEPNKTYTVVSPVTLNRFTTGWITQEPATGVPVNGVDTTVATSRVIQTGDNAKYLVCYYWNKNVDIGDAPDMCVNLGNDTTYHAYAGQTYDITFPTEAGTVYGGKLTVNADGSGSLVVDHSILTVNGSEKLYSAGAFYNGAIGTDRYATLDRNTGVFKLPTAEQLSDFFVCSNTAIWGNPDVALWKFAINGRELHMVFENAVVGITESMSNNERTTAIQAWLAENTPSFVLPLATPVSYTLTPTEIRTLLGTNNVWADTGDVALTYTGTDEHLTLESGKKYLARLSGTDSMLLGSGQEITAAKGTDNVFDLTQMFGTAVADYVYGQGAGFFRKWFGKQWYPYNAGELRHVEGLQSHDMVGFNQWDEEVRHGYYNEQTGAFVESSAYCANKNPIPAFPNTVYYGTEGSTYVDTFLCYDSGMNYLGTAIRNADNTRTTRPNTAFINFRTRQAYGGTYKHDICINLAHNNSRNGEYAPYEKHSYPLDSTVILRGIPKVGANGVYWDGDRYLPDGTVERRYGVVDLGTLTWRRQGVGFSTDLPLSKHASGVPGLRNATCIKYTIGQSAQNAYNGNEDKVFFVNSTYLGAQGKLYVYDSAYSDAASFKSAMSGVMLVYELETPTTETAQPYHSTQWVSDWGTEEFVSTGIVPVGHETRYPANLRDKLQHLPDAASGNGSYLITQTDGQMVLTPFPAPPSTAGNYVLKATVVNGVATYTWEVAT